MVERIWYTSKDGVRESSIGDTLISGKGNAWNGIDTPFTIEGLLSELPDGIREYTKDCLFEHQTIIDSLIVSGYEPKELCFRDYLSGPQHEIAGNNIPLLNEAFNDVRYELIPTVIFFNRKLENPNDDIAETSSLFVEFHKRGMAF